MGLISQEEIESTRYKLVNVPDSQLSQKELRLKRQQIALMQGQEQRQINKKERERKEREMREMKEGDPEKYLKILY